jgi:hypothetical protein
MLEQQKIPDLAKSHPVVCVSLVHQALDRGHPAEDATLNRPHKTQEQSLERYRSTMR